MALTRTAATLAFAAAMAAALGACNGDDAPQETRSPTASQSATASPSVMVTGSDQSAVVLGTVLPPAKGKAAGRVDRSAATLNVGSIRVSSTGSVLTYWYTGSPDMINGQGQLSWENRPTLVDPVGKKVYEPVTFTNNDGVTVCICTDAAYIDVVPQPLTIAYPPVPAGVTTLQVRQTGFPAISVPVTR